MPKTHLILLSLLFSLGTLNSYASDLRPGMSLRKAFKEGAVLVVQQDIPVDKKVVSGFTAKNWPSFSPDPLEWFHYNPRCQFKLDDSEIPFILKAHTRFEIVSTPRVGFFIERGKNYALLHLETNHPLASEIICHFEVEDLRERDLTEDGDLTVQGFKDRVLNSTTDVLTVEAK